MRKIEVNEKAPQIIVNKPLREAQANAVKALNVFHSRLRDNGIDSRASARKIELMIPKVDAIRT